MDCVGHHSFKRAILKGLSQCEPGKLEEYTLTYLNYPLYIYIYTYIYIYICICTTYVIQSFFLRNFRGSVLHLPPKPVALLSVSASVTSAAAGAAHGRQPSSSLRSAHFRQLQWPSKSQRPPWDERDPKGSPGGENLWGGNGKKRWWGEDRLDMEHMWDLNMICERMKRKIIGVLTLNYRLL